MAPLLAAANPVFVRAGRPAKEWRAESGERAARSWPAEKHRQGSAGWQARFGAEAPGGVAVPGRGLRPGRA